MKCHICGHLTIGQCKRCARFYCEEHQAKSWLEGKGYCSSCETLYARWMVALMVTMLPAIGLTVLSLITENSAFCGISVLFWVFAILVYWGGHITWESPVR